MADVFISYQHDDRAAAERVAQRLAADGLSVWWDTSLVAGDEWTDTIRAELKAAKVVLVLWSNASWASRWVQAEATAGHQRDCLVAARLDDVTLEPPFNIVQTADLRMGADGIDRLIDGIRRRTGAGAVRSAVRPKTAEPLLAVLPFDNLSNDPELQFFSDGVSEEILHTVARAKGLKVIGKASSFQFRGVDKVVRKVVNELHATHVLDGSVRRVGNHVRLSAQLVEASSQTTLWSERYDRDLTDVFQLQDEIAAAIAQNLQTRFKANARPSIDPAVYDLYLQARAALMRDWSPIDLQTSQTVLEQVVARAPDFASAWGLLAAMRVVLLPNDRDCIGEPAHRAVSAAVDRALSLDPDCADAIGASVGLLPAFGSYAEKLSVTQKAIELAPNDTTIVSLRAFALASVGRIGESLDTHCRSVQTDPLQSWPHAQYAMALYAAGDIDRALQMIDRAAERFPHAPWVWLSHVVLLAHLGLNDGGRRLQAIAKLDGATALQTADGAIGSYLASSGAALRKLLEIAVLPPTEREGTLEPLLVSGPDRSKGASAPVPTPAVNIFVCECAAALGHQDIAFASLFTALDTGQPIFSGGGARWFTSRGFFWLPGSALRRDSRFPRLCARLGLVDHWRTSGQWPDCANEVPYDFKAECLAAEAQVAQGR